MKPCPLCRDSYANRPQHLGDFHCVTDGTERRLLLGMASGRYAVPLGCPVTPCHGQKYIRLDRHLKALHDMTKEDIKLILEESRRKEIASQLSAIRETKQQAGSASQRPAPKKHKKDFEYLIAMFEKRNLKRDKLQFRRTVKRFRRFVRYMWGVGSTPPSHLMFLSKTRRVIRWIAKQKMKRLAQTRGYLVDILRFLVFLRREGFSQVCLSAAKMRSLERLLKQELSTLPQQTGTHHLADGPPPHSQPPPTTSESPTPPLPSGSPVPPPQPQTHLPVLTEVSQVEHTPVPDDQLSTIPKQTGTHHLAEVQSNEFASGPSTTPASEDSRDDNSDDSASGTPEGDDQSDYRVCETSDTNEQSEESTSEYRSSSAEEESDHNARQALQSRVAMDSTETASPPDTLIPSEDRPFLPPVVIQRIIEEMPSMEMAMLGVFNRVTKTFQELAKPFCPSIYINDSLAGDLNLQKDSLIHTSVGKIYKTAGSSSGLALRLKSLSNRSNWLSARLVMRHVAHSRYLIEEVSLA
ncbi:hypothetical protein EPR50_G00113520 [Perca flavescens]|uniref:Uncharacterized protein n=1 Tax=Perca flavescens TaxID=8167 RepID=A0A484CUR7_PERFV|nr:hypothetical protein EPR50_G00113520 [Perca flavescens]